MTRRLLGLFLLTVSVLFVGLAFADDPPSGKTDDDPPVRLKKKDKGDAAKPAPDKPDDAKPPMKDDKKEAPKKDDAKEPAEPPAPQEDEAEVLNRIAKNIRMAEEKIGNKELGDGTRQLQEDILKDLDSLIHAAENPPPQGGGGEDNQDQANNQNQQSKSGSMGKQSGKQGSGSQQGRSARTARRQQRNGGTQQAKGGNRQGSGDPMQGMGQGDKNTQQANKGMGGGNNSGGGGTSKEGPNKNADLYKDVWGHLPPALRAEMDAYSNDKQFMSKYDELIKRYYRSIAEEGRKKEGK